MSCAISGCSSCCVRLLVSLFVCFFGLYEAPLAFAWEGGSLPKFTEEREAAALHFVKKHSPDLVPLLEELRREAPTQYEHQIREIFRVTEMLADLQEEPRRYDVELRIWKLENQGTILSARLANAKEKPDQEKLEAALLTVAQDLVKLEAESLEIQAEILTRDLEATRSELTRLRGSFERTVRERFDLFVQKARKPIIKN